MLPSIKTVILLDWCRIFVVGSRIENTFWLSCMAIIALQWVWGLACIILLNLQCIPHTKIWEFYLPGKCISLHTIQLCSASIQLFSDLAMTCLPHKVVWGLQMTSEYFVSIPSFPISPGLRLCIWLLKVVQEALCVSGTCLLLRDAENRVIDNHHLLTKAAGRKKLGVSLVFGCGAL